MSPHRCPDDPLLAAQRVHAMLLDRVDHDAVRQVVELHKPEKTCSYDCYASCAAADGEGGGYEWEPSEWPCPTIDALLKHYGISTEVVPGEVVHDPSTVSVLADGLSLREGQIVTMTGSALTKAEPGRWRVTRVGPDGSYDLAPEGATP